MAHDCWLLVVRNLDWFLFQSEMPEFLGYHENKEGDFEFVLNHIDEEQYSNDLKCLFLENISKVEQLTSDQKNKINKKIEKCSWILE